MAAPFPEAGLLYPFTLGLVATVNPCGFPLLPAYLSGFVETGRTDEGGVLGRSMRALSSGTLATLGFVVLFGAVGLVVELGISAAYDAAAAGARWVMVVVGIAMVLLGLATLAGRPIRLPRPTVRADGGGRRLMSPFLFGIGYGIASLGCSLPLFIAGVASSFASFGFVEGLTTFLAYGLGMGLLLTVLAVVVAVAGPAAAKRWRVVSRVVPALGGGLLVATGLYLVAHWLSVIFDPASTPAPDRLIDGLQTAIAGTVTAHPVALGAALGGVVIGILLVFALRGRAPEPPPSEPAEDQLPTLSQGRSILRLARVNDASGRPRDGRVEVRYESKNQEHMSTPGVILRRTKSD